MFAIVDCMLIVWRVSKIVHASLMIQILVIALAQHDPAVVSEDVYVPLSNHGLVSHKRTYSKQGKAPSKVG